MRCAAPPIRCICGNWSTATRRKPTRTTRTVTTNGCGRWSRSSTTDGSGAASTKKEHPMVQRIVRCIAGIAALLFTPAAALSHDEHEGHGHAGTVTFPNSCAPEVQAELMRGVAMLHSFWFGAGEQAFRSVLAKDPSCAIADWGIASILMYNPLNGVGPGPKDAEKAQAAIDAGRVLPAKTQRERDYLEGVAAYYQDWAS